MTWKLSVECASRVHERIDFDVLSAYADETISTLHLQLEATSDEIVSANIRGAIQACRQLHRLKEQCQSILRNK